MKTSSSQEVRVLFPEISTVRLRQHNINLSSFRSAINRDQILEEIKIMLAEQKLMSPEAELHAFLETAETCEAWGKDRRFLGNCNNKECYSQEQVDFVTYQKRNSALSPNFLCKLHYSVMDQILCCTVASLTQKYEGPFHSSTSPNCCRAKSCSKA